MNNFLLISLSPWDFERGSNIRDIAEELSKNNKVVFVNIPMKRSELLQKKKKWVQKRNEVIKSKKNDIEQVNENLSLVTTPVVFEPINRLKPNWLFDYLNKINNKRYAKAIKSALTELGMQDFILINDNDFYSGQYLPGLLSPGKSVFYLRDYLRGMDYWKVHADRIEPKALANYDMVLSNSTYLAKYASEFNSTAHYVGQGCDVTFFLEGEKNVAARPKDLESLDGKLIGYVGALNSERLDIDLIAHLAKDQSGNQIVLVGPEDEGFKQSELHKLSNVHFLGSKDFSTLNDYLYNFDVCINPQKINPITIGNYPRKIDEYLAVGKPTVASYTDSMQPFNEVCYLAKDKEEFSKLTTKALTENDKKLIQDRKQLASDHTWENSVNMMIDRIFAQN